MTTIRRLVGELLQVYGGPKEYARLRRMYRIQEVWPDVPTELPDIFYIDIRGAIKRLPEDPAPWEF